jgi:hypothetical protein
LDAHFCDNFSTTRPITLNKISLESLDQSPVKLKIRIKLFDSVLKINMKYIEICPYHGIALPEEGASWLQKFN